MGCFNGTCMVTGMPIMSSEAVVGFYIARLDIDRRPPGNVCYPDDLAFPISLPIHGQYDDYGNVDPNNQNDVAVKHILKKLKFKTIGDLNDAIHSNGRFNKEKVTVDISTGSGRTKAPVGLVMISGHIYNEFSKADDKEVDEIYQRLLSQNKINTLSVLAGYLDLNMMQHSMMGRLLPLFDSAPVESNVIEKISASEPRVLMELARAYAERHSFMSSLLVLRRTWAGQSGAGSQSYDWVHHLKLAGLVRDHILKNHMEDLYSNECYKLL